MKKIRLIRTTIIEYIPVPDYYPLGFTIEQMAELDSKQKDREVLFSTTKETTFISDEVNYEILEEIS